MPAEVHVSPGPLLYLHHTIISAAGDSLEQVILGLSGIHDMCKHHESNLQRLAS